jgi:acetyl-CoA synthetase
MADTLENKQGLFYPTKEIKKKSWIKDEKIYRDSLKDPIKFWEKLAKELSWKKKWKKGFEHNPPFFKWFLEGKLNITENALDRHLKDKADKIALIWEPESFEEKPRVFTYKELFREVNKAANALKKLGVKKGDRVGIYMPVVPEAVISMLACARIGAVHSVVFSAFSPSALKIRLQILEAEVLITADGYYRRGGVINLKQNADQGIMETMVKKMIVVKRLNNEIPWDSKKDLWWQDLINKEPDFCEPETMDSEDLLFVLFTSGTTGTPKGCEHVCGGYMVQAYWTGKWIFNYSKDTVFWSSADIGWITGATYSCYSPLLNGITFVLFEGCPDWPGPERWAQIIEKHKVTAFYTAPTAIRMFKKALGDKIKKYSFENLELIASVGEPIDESSWLWYFEGVGKSRCPLLDTWWQTETGGILISSLPGIGPFRPSFAGRPFPGVRFDVLDEKGNSLPDGKEGDLVVLPPFSPGLLRGAYKNPQKYLETYWTKHGQEIYDTSDAAFKENGLFRIVGRMDDVIKVAGHRLTTGELESVINSHPEVAECAILGIPDTIKGEVPVAFVVPKDENPCPELKQKVMDFVRKEIGAIASLKEVYLVEDLPKTRSGKIMRRILKKICLKEELGDLSTLSNPEIVESIQKLMSSNEQK